MRNFGTIIENVNSCSAEQPCDIRSSQNVFGWKSLKQLVKCRLVVNQLIHSGRGGLKRFIKIKTFLPIEFFLMKLPLTVVFIIFLKKTKKNYRVVYAPGHTDFGGSTAQCSRTQGMLCVQLFLYP